jgi:hypothetical protein
MSRDDHVQAVGFAGLQIQELENLIITAKERQQECLNLVATAVGEAPVVESARNALEFTAALGDRLDEVAGMCESIKAELNRYGGGF